MSSSLRSGGVFVAVFAALPSGGPSKAMSCILILDDDPLVRRVLGRALTKDGHVVLEAENGAAVLERMRQHEVELVITDIFMPKADGLETIRKVREEFATIPIIAISGGGSHEFTRFLEVAELLGACQCLQKPLDLQKLKNAVTEALSS
jgi:CheY-like chemotaxis protein